MVRSLRTNVAFVLGLLMVALGGWLLANAYVLHRPPVSGKPLIDAAFAFFFLLRGAMNVRTARRLREAGKRTTPDTPG
jgi:hypothetical protein